MERPIYPACKPICRATCRKRIRCFSLVANTAINERQQAPALPAAVARGIAASLSAQEIAERERELREEEAAELARERHEAARRKVEGDAKRKAEEVEAKFQKEMQIARAMEVKNRFALGRRSSP